MPKQRNFGEILLGMVQESHAYLTNEVEEKCLRVLSCAAAQFSSFSHFNLSPREIVVPSLFPEGFF